MGQHGSAHHVADGPDVAGRGLAFLIHLDEAAIIQGHAGLFSKQTVRVWPPPDAHDDLIHGQRLLTLTIFVSQTDAVLGRRGTRDPGSQPNIQPLLFKLPLRVPGDIPIRHEQKVLQGFQHHDVGAQPLPHAAQFQADDATANNAQPLRHGVELQRAPGIDDALIVEGHRRQLDGC